MGEVVLIIISLHGGITRLPMDNGVACATAAAQFNVHTTKTAVAHCVKNLPKPSTQ